MGDYGRVNSAHILLLPGEYSHVLSQEVDEEVSDVVTQLGPDVDKVFWLVVKLYGLQLF